VENLKFKRQFLLLNQNMAVPAGWIKSEFQHQQSTWYLSNHPDLPVFRASGTAFQLIMAGYMLEPMHPEMDDQNVLDYLAQCADYERLIEMINRINGRFVLLVLEEKSLRILNDATGFREIYYYIDDNMKGCASTQNLLAETLGLKMTQNQDILDFFNSAEFAQNDRTWVGFDTLYDGIKQLCPNHWLDLQSGTLKRFWPVKVLDKIDIDACVEESALILKGTVHAAVNRYRVHVGITAGWDTRLILSCTKDFKDKIFYYINNRTPGQDVTRDIDIARRLSKRLNFPLHLIEIDETVDAGFKEIFFKNNVLAREKLLPVFYDIYKRNWLDTYTISGTMGNGLARIYMRIPKDFEVSGRNVAAFTGYGKLKYPVQALENWVEETKNLCERVGINIMDLYQWEQDNNHWASLASSEQDIVREEIRPFNNRHLLELFWSVKEKYRYQYNPAIYTRIMNYLWKDVTREPLNPSRQTRIYKLLRMIGIERVIYRHYKRRKFIKYQQN
jgi:hypothetical protein